MGEDRFNVSALLTPVVIDFAFLSTTLSGGESKRRAQVDVTLADLRTGKELYRKEGATDDHATVHVHSGRGPYRVCFSLLRSNVFMTPSATIDLEFFDVFQRSIGKAQNANQIVKSAAGGAGTGRAASSASLGSTLSDLEAADATARVRELSGNLRSIMHEQRYLSARHERHLRTVRSTHSRAFLVSVGMALVICGVAGAQVFMLKTIFYHKRAALSTGRFA